MTSQASTPAGRDAAYSCVEHQKGHHVHFKSCLINGFLAFLLAHVPSLLSCVRVCASLLYSWLYKLVGVNVNVGVCGHREEVLLPSACFITDNMQKYTAKGQISRQHNVSGAYVPGWLIKHLLPTPVDTVAERKERGGIHETASATKHQLFNFTFKETQGSSVRVCTSAHGRTGG